MATPAQIAANRRNALRSTGPRTLEGKLAASRNALRHGLSSNAALLLDEDPAEFDHFRQSLHDALHPACPLEAALVERIVLAAWRLRRASRFEAGLLDSRACRLVAHRARQAADDLERLCDPDPDWPSDNACPLDERAVYMARQPELDASEALTSPTMTFAVSFADRAPQLALLIRYESSLDRSLFRAMHELQRLQAARAGRPVPPPAVLEVNLNPVAE